MTANSTLERGREAFERKAWSEAFNHLSTAAEEAQLEPEDLERLAMAAYVVGQDVEAADVWAQAHQQFLSAGNVERAVRCAFWLAFGLMNRGEPARGGGWIARARRLLDETDPDCVEEGYLLLPAGLQLIGEGDFAGAYDNFCRAAEIGDGFDDPDLVALARHSQGRALIRMGEIRRGVNELDEAMVAVEAREVSPVVVGDVYCSVIEGCLEIFDLRRAQEWTAALMHWFDAHPDVVPYSGQCLVRRAEILQLHGAWSDAVDAAQQACERFLGGPNQAATGEAFYQQGELHRLRGKLDEAEEAYRQASRWGRKPQPGLALLRLARGDTKVAADAIRLAVDEAKNRAARSKLLPAQVEILLAAGDVPAARVAAEELAEIAAELDAPLLHGVAAQGRGAVLLAEGDADDALVALRQAWTSWQELEAPYEAARVRVLTGLAYRTLGDEDAAEMELDAARWVFQQLGARIDLARVEELSRPAEPKIPGGLSRRELEVLRHVALGKTNRAVATDLFISERTVERHLSNIFAKLNVSSRSQATAFAYEHELV